MSRLGQTFTTLKQQRRAALITYLMAGDPDLSTTETLIPILTKHGADIIELGVPFSDPVADGPIIQAACQRALRNGVTLKDVLTLVGRVRPRVEVPLVLMTYFNPVHRYGPERFAQDAAACGVDGIIIPDLPLEEAGLLKSQADALGLATIFLAAPNSPPERIRALGHASQGFLYCLSTTGVTGPRQELPSGVMDFVKEVRRYTDKPLAVGFGITTAEQAARVATFADAVVIGSALVKIVAENRGKTSLPQKLAEAVARLAKGVRGDSSASRSQHL